MLVYVVIGTLKKHRSTKLRLFIEIREGYGEHCPVSRLSTNETFRQEMVFMTRYQSSSSYFFLKLRKKAGIKLWMSFYKGKNLGTST